MLKLHSFNDINYQQALTPNNSGQFLTTDGWNSVHQQLVKQGILEKMKKNIWLSTVGTQMGPMPY